MLLFNTCTYLYLMAVGGKRGGGGEGGRRVWEEGRKRGRGERLTRCVFYNTVRSCRIQVPSDGVWGRFICALIQMTCAC